MIQNISAAAATTFIRGAFTTSFLFKYDSLPPLTTFKEADVRAHQWSIFHKGWRIKSSCQAAAWMAVAAGIDASITHCIFTAYKARYDASPPMWVRCACRVAAIGAVALAAHLVGPVYFAPIFLANAGIDIAQALTTCLINPTAPCHNPMPDGISGYFPEFLQLKQSYLQWKNASDEPAPVIPQNDYQTFQPLYPESPGLGTYTTAFSISLLGFLLSSAYRSKVDFKLKDREGKEAQLSLATLQETAIGLPEKPFQYDLSDHGISYPLSQTSIPSLMQSCQRNLDNMHQESHRLLLEYEQMQKLQDVLNIEEQCECIQDINKIVQRLDSPQLPVDDSNLLCAAYVRLINIQKTDEDKKKISQIFAEQYAEFSRCINNDTGLERINLRIEGLKQAIYRRVPDLIFRPKLKFYEQAFERFKHMFPTGASEKAILEKAKHTLALKQIANRNFKDVYLDYQIIKMTEECYLVKKQCLEVIKAHQDIVDGSPSEVKGNNIFAHVYRQRVEAIKNEEEKKRVSKCIAQEYSSLLSFLSMGNFRELNASLAEIRNYRQSLYAKHPGLYDLLSEDNNFVSSEEEEMLDEWTTIQTSIKQSLAKLEIYKRAQRYLDYQDQIAFIKDQNAILQDAPIIPEQPETAGYLLLNCYNKVINEARSLEDKKTASQSFVDKLNLKLSAGSAEQLVVSSLEIKKLLDSDPTIKDACHQIPVSLAGRVTDMTYGDVKYFSELSAEELHSSIEEAKQVAQTAEWIKSFFCKVALYPIKAFSGVCPARTKTWQSWTFMAMALMG